MKRLLYLLFFCALPLQVGAQTPTLLARYPMKMDGKDQMKKNSHLKLVGTTFENGSIKCEGAYDDFEAGKGKAVLVPSITNSDIQSVSIRIDFKVSAMGDMPVFSVDRGCRLLMFYLTSAGKVEFRANNGDIKKVSNLAYQANTWHTATIVYHNKTAIIYLDTKEALRTPLTLSNSCGVKNVELSTVNFSNGQVFKGYWRDLRIYKGAWAPQSTENPVPDKPIDIPPPPIVTPNTTLGSWKSIDVAVTGKPNATPSSLRRQFFSLKNKAGNLDVIWQDEANKKIYLSRFDASCQKATQTVLPSPANTLLLAATNDDQDNYYYAVFKENKKSNAGGENDILTICKADKNGKQLVQQVQSSADKDLDIWDIGHFTATLAYNKGYLAMFMGRRMNKGGDGLNHQGGIGVLFDANTLQVKRNFGQTSGHSFDNFLMVNQSGEFVGMDLGDNYPRGINMHKFNETSSYIKMKLIYTFKTQHGTEARSPAGRTYPKYDEISTAKQAYYKWSNDNGTYTELGGIVEVNDGYLVFFAGEPDEAGKSINNARAVGYESNDSRNLGFVKVRKDYENAQTLKEAILSKGASESGGFYTFGGSWSKQQNEGVNWLTKFKNPKTENVMYIKTVRLPNGNALVVYAVDKSGWGDRDDSYQPYMMCLDAQGKTVLPATTIDKKISLSRRDEALLLGNKIVLVQGIANDNNTGTLRLHILDLK